MSGHLGSISPRCPDIRPDEVDEVEEVDEVFWNRRAKVAQHAPVVVIRIDVDEVEVSVRKGVHGSLRKASYH